MKTCRSCGLEQERAAVFCADCGAYVGWDHEAAEVKSPTVPAPRSPEPGSPDGRTSKSAAVAHEPDDGGRRLAMEYGRADLVVGLDAADRRRKDRSLAVAVAGEFKRGKSTLVNALLRTEVCPVDADLVTALPTFVRYGDQVGATAFYHSPSGLVRGEEIPVEAVANLVNEQKTDQTARPRSVEIRLRHRLLATGLCLIDTPGVGGLESAHGLLTVGALDQADALAFVTDASQELTAPELDFLRTALERCPGAVCVLTKTDLYPEWRRIADINRSHLRAAGIELDILPVSSLLRLRSRREPDLGKESGFGPLLHFLAGVVLEHERAAAQEAAAESRFVAGQLAREIVAEKEVVEHPEQAGAVVSRLEEAHSATARLTSAGATWQQTLTDGVQDLIVDVEHDLQQRLRTVFRDAEALVDESDPREEWAHIETWLRRQVAAAAIANQDVLTDRSHELVERVADGFALDAGEPMELADLSTAARVEQVELAGVESFARSTGRLGSLLFATRNTVYLPMVLFGAASAVSGGTAIAVAPIAALLGAAIGRTVVKDERQRQLVHRRQQAKVNSRRYVDEVSFVVGKDCRDTLRQVQRQLRDEFQHRAASIHRSNERALVSARSARELTAEQRQTRADQLTGLTDQLRRLERESVLVGVGAVTS